jgi:hypothetical protein
LLKIGFVSQRTTLPVLTASALAASEDVRRVRYHFVDTRLSSAVSIMTLPIRLEMTRKIGFVLQKRASLAEAPSTRCPGANIGAVERKQAVQLVGRCRCALK